MQDLEFDGSYSYQDIESIIEEKPLFSYPGLNPFTDSTFNTPVWNENQLLDTLTTLLFIHHEVEDDNDSLSLSSSEHDFSPP